MINDPQNQAPAPGAPGDPSKKKALSWPVMKARANSVSGVIALLVALLVVGGLVGYGLALLRQTPAPKQPVIQTLTPDDIKKLTDGGTDLGTPNQVLNIGANTVFRGKVDVGSDLSVGGRFNANGPVTLSQLNITGTTAATGLSVGSNLTVAGLTALQRGATVGELLAVNGGLNVSGTASVNSLNATSISVRNINISGPLTIGHVITQGAPPSVAAGSAVGSGGTVNISGNDTTGTLNVSTGGSPPAGVLATIVFRASFGTTVHVLLTPLTGASASLPVYVTRTATGFQVRTDTAPPAGTVFGFDYFVAQ